MTLEWLVGVHFIFFTATPQNVAAGSGTYIATRNLASALSGLGHRIEVVAPSWQRTVPAYALRRYLLNRALARRTWDADVLVGFDLDGFLVARGDLPFVTYVHGQLADEARFERGVTRLSMQIQARWEARAVRRADRGVTLSQYARGEIHRRYGVPLDRIAVVPPAFDGPGFVRRLDAVGAVPRDSAVARILSVSRLYRRKNLPALVAAAARLRAKGHRVEVRIVGDGPDRRRVERAVCRQGLGDTVSLLGHVAEQQLLQEYRAADVFCLPSLQEGFGMVFLEAMAASLPVVACRAGATPEVVPDGVAGLLVPPANDGEALAGALSRVLDDATERGRLGAAGRERVSEYTLASTGRSFMAAVSDLGVRRDGATTAAP